VLLRQLERHANLTAASAIALMLMRRPEATLAAGIGAPQLRCDTCALADQFNNESAKRRAALRKRIRDYQELIRPLAGHHATLDGGH
jgi:hypothetical protein